MTALLPELPTDLARESDGVDVGHDYMSIVKTHIYNHPRSQQKRIGPSELGHPCARRIGYKLLGQPERDTGPAWLPTVGTAVHAWLEEAFDADNLAHAAERNHQERWLVENRVSVGEVNGVEVTGSSDLYDRFTGTVIDHKVVGPTQLKKYKAHGPGDQYRSQGHLYGRGFTRAGLRVKRVMIVFLPRNGSLDDAYIWSETYDEQVALDALQRVTGISLVTAALGHAALGHLEAVESYCAMCPYLRRGSTDLAAGCPGADSGGDQPPALTLA